MASLYTPPIDAPVPYIWPSKRQHDITPRVLDVAKWLFTGPAAIAGDTISAAAATVSPAVYGGVTVQSVLVSGAAVTVWLAGGVEGQWYVVIVTISTMKGRTEDFPVQIAIPPVAVVL